MITTATGQSIVPGTVDTGIHCDDCTGTIAFPFPVYLYGQSYTNAEASSNGNLQFTSADTSWTNECLPTSVAPIQAAFFPYWDDLRTDGAGEGVYTATTGSAPNRVFYVEWRAEYFGAGGHGEFRGRVQRERSGVEDGVRRDDEWWEHVDRGCAGRAAGRSVRTVRL